MQTTKEEKHHNEPLSWRTSRDGVALHERGDRGRDVSVETEARAPRPVSAVTIRTGAAPSLDFLKSSGQ